MDTHVPVRPKGANIRKPSPTVVVDIRVPVRPDLVRKVISNRISNSGEEEYLVQWKAGSDFKRIPFSWHCVQELSKCLQLVQEYLENIPTNDAKTSLKRKSPDDGFPTESRSLSPSITSNASASTSSTASTSMSSVARSLSPRFYPDTRMYNGVLKVQDGHLIMTKPTDDSVPTLEPSLVPTPYMLERAAASPTPSAHKYIRAEALRKLSAIPGPPVKLVNIRDEQSPPLSFAFIDNSITRKRVRRLSLSTLEGCQRCRPNMGQNIGCEYTTRCSCLEYAAVDEGRLTPEQRPEYERVMAVGGDTSGFPKRFPYFKNGCLVPFYMNTRNVIYECNANCACGPICKNRVVQHGRRVPLEIFKTDTRGWGLRSPVPIREGQFIDTYRGEIVTDGEATRRTEGKAKDKESYLYSLDKFQNQENFDVKDLYVVDGETMGGPTRFINHSCDPNCWQFAVSMNKNDPRVYELAFFANREIPAGEELTFDYKDNDGVVDDEEGAEAEEDGVPCLCGSKNCRKWLWK